MVGGGSVFLRAKSEQVASKYWINDAFRDLILFWRFLKDQSTCEKLQNRLRKLRQKFTTAEELKEYYLKARDSEPTDDFDAAVKFFFFNRVTFSGTTQAGGFSEAASELRFTETSIERLSPMPRALKRTKITNVDFSRVIEATGEGVFLFIDPPYYSASKLYGKHGSLHNFDHDLLVSLLKETKHKFLITYDDCPEIRKMYKWADFNPANLTVEPWNLTYGMNNCNLENTCKVGSELFIYNY